jgi:hypothetical protein
VLPGLEDGGSGGFHHVIIALSKDSFD